MNGLLTFLLDRDDLACLEALCPEALRGTVVAFDPDLHIHLLARDLDHLTPWDVVDQSERPAVREFEQAVWQFWETNAQALFDGVDLLAMVPFRHKSCFSRIAWAAYIIRRVFEKTRPKRVIVFEEKTGHGLEQPPEHNKMPLLQALVRGAAEQGGLPVRVLRRDEASGSGGFVDWAASNARGRLAPIDLSEVLGDRPYVLFPGSGVDLLRPLAVIRQLHADGELDVVQIYKSANPSTLKQLETVGHHVYHESQVIQEATAPLCPPCAVESRRRFDEARRRVPARLQPIFANPHMDIHFDFIFGEYLSKMAWNVRVWKSFFERHPPQVLVATSSSPISDLADSLDIPSLGLPHGSMMIGNTRWFECYRCSIIGAISQPHRERLIESGIEAERIVVTGDPGLDMQDPPAHTGSPKGVPLLLSSAATDHVERHYSRAAAHSLNQVPRSVSPHQRAILLIMGNMGMLAKLGALPLYDWADSVRCFKQLGELAGAHPEWRFLVRPHPRYDHPELYELVNRDLPAAQRVVVLDNEPMNSVLQSVDVVVVCNIVTSALLECSLGGKPVVVLSKSMIWYDAHEWATQYWLHLPSVETLEGELQAMFNNATRYEACVRRTESAVEHYLAGVDQPAASRCVDLIYESAGRPINT